MDGYGKRVLLVDDDDGAKQLLAQLLEHAQYNIRLADDGLQALEEMKKRHFDAVITDYRMPRMNGIEFMLLSQVVWPDTPVILLSGDTEDLADYAIERGAFSWIRKPYETQLLLSVLRSATQLSFKDRWNQTVARMSG